MPTLQQLNIDTETQEKLSTGGGGIKRKLHPSSSSSAASNNNEQVKLSPHNTKKKHWSPPKPKSNSTTTSNTHYAPIKTPSALLSRNPTQLSNALQTSLTTIKSIRNNAAIEIINNDYIGHGKQCEEIIHCVSRYCIANHNDDNQQQLKLSKQHRPTALLAGAVTALDLCARELLLKNISKSSTLHGHSNTASMSRGGQDCISTGSKSIDQLLAPDSSYTSFDQGWTISYPYKIPSNNYEAANQHQTAVNNTCPHPSSSSSSHGGVPFGMVTEISGPPSSGKTQLALSIAAHAVLTNQMDVHYISGGNSTKALSRRLFSIFLELARSSVVVRYQQNGAQNGSGSGDVSSSMTYEMEEEAKSIALKALDRVHVASVPDAYSLLAMLARIDEEEKSSRSCSNNGKVRKEGEGGTLLVVDSISGCLGHHLSSVGGAALANQVALTLRQLARTHDGHIMDSVNSSSSGVATSSASLLARRFAVVVTNGSVAKYSLDNKEQSVGSSSTTKATTSTSVVNQSQNKPAMGRYWHVSDVGIWLEEDKSTPRYPQQHQQPINFYDDTSVVGLALSEKKVVCATLQNHHGKSCRSRVGSGRQMNDKPIAKFRIRGGGIDDLES